MASAALPRANILSLLCERLGTTTVMALAGAIYLAVAAVGWSRPDIRASPS